MNAAMKTRLLSWFSVATIAAANSVSSLAANDTRQPAPAPHADDPGTIILDVVVVRPACLAVTVAGAAFFVVALPVAAISKSVRPTANALMVKPAKATFTRPVGDMDALLD